MGYAPAWHALRNAGARLVPIKVDAAGLRVDELRARCARERLRAVYVTPHHQYPTTAVLAPGRRLELLELARAERLAIIEDDYDHEFHYDGRPVLPLSSADRDGVAIYIGTLSKILAPGLRIGFVVAPAPFLHSLAQLRLHSDRQGDHAVECAVAELIEDGELQRHARRARALYKSRRDALAEALDKRLGDRLRFELPHGGLALWARAACDPVRWSERALERGVAISAGGRFHFAQKPLPFARLGFAACDERELHEAARRLAAAWPSE
jgi:GntR family transcriptional regulator/MocR family aminotransferase